MEQKLGTTQQRKKPNLALQRLGCGNVVPGQPTGFVAISKWWDVTCLLLYMHIDKLILVSRAVILQFDQSHPPKPLTANTLNKSIQSHTEI